MKEIFFAKWMPFHFIFYKNADWLILPCICFCKVNIQQHIEYEIIFGFMQWRMSIILHSK